VIEKDAISVVYFYQTSVRLHNKENLIILFFKKVKKKSVGIIFWGWLRGGCRLFRRRMGSVWESRFERKGIKQPTVKSHI
jgi:hypothetical protein